MYLVTEIRPHILHNLFKTKIHKTAIDNEFKSWRVRGCHSYFVCEVLQYWPYASLAGGLSAFAIPLSVSAQKRKGNRFYKPTNNNYTCTTLINNAPTINAFAQYDSVTEQRIAPSKLSI